MEPWYKFEPTPITRKDRPEGGSETQLSDLSGRVVDGYTNMPIGAVIYQADRRFHAHSFFPEKVGPGWADSEIEGEWGPRADLAAKAIWARYWKQFRWTERVPRYMWRYRHVGWLVLGTIIGAVAQLILRNL